WITILRKREAFRAGFAGLDTPAVARFGEPEVQALLTDAGIVRHRGKIAATIDGARAFLQLEESYPGGFPGFVWETVGGRPRVNRPGTSAGVPAVTPEAEILSMRLKRAGFRFVGPTIVYAFMQAAGLVDDHVADCFKAT
ncbi:MAG: DNA-3-methyladenine glycosylase I, partial [Tistlia sp.]